MTDILYDAAKEYSLLKNITYRIILGRKQITYELMLHFPAESFFHLAGLHYLKDINFKTKNKTLIFTKILNKEITIDDIKKSVFYVEEEIENRISNLQVLCEVIESDETKYLINKNEFRKYTSIVADYLMEYNKKQKTFYLFCVLEKNDPVFENECLCRSFFQKGKVDYRKGAVVTKSLAIFKITDKGCDSENCETIYLNPVYKDIKKQDEKVVQE